MIDIWVATRPSVGAAFGAPSPLNEVNSAANDYGPFLSSDGLLLYFGSDRAGGMGSADVWVAARDTPTGPLREPVNVASLNTPAADDDVTMDATGTAMVFSSTRTGEFQLYTAAPTPCL